MLSKVAERLYWTSRYLERVENTARLLSVYDQLLYDLPSDINIGWYNLIELNKSDELFHERYRVQSEHNVAKFLLADDTNPNSMLSVLAMVRENVRTTRDTLPEDSWEMVNEFYIYAKETINDGIKRSSRHEFLNEIICNCQMIHGMLSSTMRRDAGWQFIKLGQSVERADMTTRILDAGATELMKASVEEMQVNLRQVVWGNVLRSDSAYSAYRRTVKSSISGPAVANFLLKDPYFPRSLSSCLGQIVNAAATLPKGETLDFEPEIKALEKITLNHESDLQQSFRDQLNEIQIRLNKFNMRIAQTWFGQDTFH